MYEEAKPKIIFFAGPHCSGKSSILKCLYKDRFLTEWGPEIGKELFYERSFDTEMQDEVFEYEVSEREVERDIGYAKKHGIIGIETWHPGNLAYAMVRNPFVVSELIHKMKESPLLSRAYGIRFCVSRESIMERTKTFQKNKYWAADFYKKIDDNLDESIKRLGLERRSMTINSDRPFEEVFLDVKRAINICLTKDF